MFKSVWFQHLAIHSKMSQKTNIDTEHACRAIAYRGPSGYVTCQTLNVFIIYV